MIELVIAEVLKRSHLSAGDDLTGFTIDADYALGEQEIFTNVDLFRSDEPTSLLNARILVRDGIAAIQDISQALAAAWQFVAYSEFQASSIVWYREATILRFVTTTGNGSLCVTGTFIARSNDYARLVNQFNAEFGPLTKSLGSVPGGLPQWAAV